MIIIANVEGPVGANLTDALKRVCSNCNGSKFYVENTTGNAGAGEGLYFLCGQCGFEELITLADLGATLNYSE